MNKIWLKLITQESSKENYQDFIVPNTQFQEKQLIQEFQEKVYELSPPEWGGNIVKIEVMN